jgi:hypothetical protein
MALNRQVRGFIGVIAMAGSLVARPAAAQDWNVAPPPDGEVQGNFDETLSPYGDWVDVDGTRAWHPSPSVVGEDFQPYATGGQWVYSDYGWYFQSDYPWGWAPFHYGRWAMDVNYGWIWVPGTVWAPAWVDWRIGGGYVGWAPLPPIGWSVVVQPWRPYWCFVPGAHFPGNFWANRLPVERVHYAYAATAPVHQAVAYGGARWYAGPPLSQVERISARPVPRVAGTLTPPAPGRVQPVHLQPPRGYIGVQGTPRPMSASPGTVRPGSAPAAPHPYQPTMSPPRPVEPGGRGVSPPPAPSGVRPSPRGSYIQPRPAAPAYAGPRATPQSSPASGFVRPPTTTSWSGATARTFSAPRPTPSFSGVPSSHVSGFGGGSRGGMGGHGGHGGGRR